MKNNKPDILLIRKYLNGEFDASAMYELEKQAQEDPVLMDVMRGMEIGDQETDEANLADLHQLIGQRGGGLKSNSRIIPWKIWAIAASFLIFSTIAALFVLRAPEEQLFTHRSPASYQKKKDTLLTIQPKTTVMKQDLAVLSKDQINPARLKENKAIVRDKSVVRIKADSSVSLASADIESPLTGEQTLEGQSLNEVVVTGFQAKKSKVLTMSASTVISKNDSVTIKQAAPINQALAGRVAGVNIRGKSKADAVSFTIIKGFVKDQNDNTPLPGVAVRLKGSREGTSTDINGRFSITVPDDKKVLELSMIGYTQQEIKLSKGDSLTIGLSPAMDALSEVVVTGYGSRSSRVKSQKAYPLIGWDAYHKYLEENATIDEGKGEKVTVAFTISGEGIPEHIRIINGSSDVVNKKALELIKGGSRWKNSDDNANKEITMKLKFH